MAGDKYIGMTFVYEIKCISELYKKKTKIVEVISKKYDGVSGYVIKNLGGIYVDGKYAAGWIYREKPSFNYLPRKLDESRHKIIWIEEIKEGIESLKNIWFEEFGRMVDEVIFRSFPPRKYLDKHRVEYEEKFPYPLGTKEGPEVVIVTKYNTCYGGEKHYIALDFGTYEKYFYSEDEKLNKAVEEFLIDLMRDIVKATEPVYAYMNLEEYRPLQYDPVCENMGELVRLWRGDGLYTVWSSMLWIPKDMILKDFEMDELRRVRDDTGKEWEVVIEEHGKHLFLYPRRMLSDYEYVEYRYKNREEEEERYRELELSMFGVCGDIKNGLKLKVPSYSGDESEKEIIKKIEEWGKRYGVRIIDIKVS